MVSKTCSFWALIHNQDIKEKNEIPFKDIKKENIKSKTFALKHPHWLNPMHELIV